jgi:flagellar basal-body rod protein FlgG
MAITALNTAATGMQALSTKMDVIANNIANADTIGFKASRTNFEDLLYQMYAQPGVQTSSESTSPLGTQIGLGTTVANTQIQFQQGSAQLTKRPLDAMIEGDGFFRVQLPGGGYAYTRYGNFVRNANGELVLGNSFGHRLADSITIDTNIPLEQVSIGSNGVVTVIGANATPQDVGQLQLTRFANPEGLIQYGSNLYLQSASSGEPIEGKPGEQGLGLIKAGTLEMSTTEAVTELVELIKAQRTFQMNSQTIQAADQTLQTVATLRR